MSHRLSFRGTGPCWVCEGTKLQRFHRAVLDFSAWREQDAELAAYTGETIWLWRCLARGFAQPDRILALPNYFERMYDQRWSAEWVAEELESPYKDVIFARILRALGRRVQRTSRTLLDVGSHAGRFVVLAKRAGWLAEATEINPRTAAYAAEKTGSAVGLLRAPRDAASGRLDRIRAVHSRRAAHQAVVCVPPRAGHFTCRRRVPVQAGRASSGGGARAARWNDAVPVVGFLGRFVAEKGLATLMSALDRLVRPRSLSAADHLQVSCRRLPLPAAIACRL